MAKDKPKTNYQKASFNLPPDLLWRFKYVSTIVNGETQTNALIGLIEDYIKKYKGKIPPNPSK